MKPTARWFWLGAVLWAGLVGWWAARAAGLTADPRPPDTAAGLTLDELCREQLDAGWRVLHAPDRPGPYTRRLPGTLYYHPAGGESVVRLRDRSGAVVWEERTRPGVSYHTVELETGDGQRAHGLLVREG